MDVENVLYVAMALLSGLIVVLLMVVIFKDWSQAQIIKAISGGLANSIPADQRTLIELLATVGMSAAAKSSMTLDDEIGKRLLEMLGYEVSGDAKSGYIVRRAAPPPGADPGGGATAK